MDVDVAIEDALSRAGGARAEDVDARPVRREAAQHGGERAVFALRHRRIAAEHEQVHRRHARVPQPRGCRQEDARMSAMTSVFDQGSRRKMFAMRRILVEVSNKG